jgi:hypothetical protein
MTLKLFKSYRIFFYVDLYLHYFEIMLKLKEKGDGGDSHTMKPATLVLGAILMFSFIGLTSSQAYDPWFDHDSDGDIDIFDIVPPANAYGTTGNPAKNITIAGHASELIILANNTLLYESDYWDSGLVNIDGYSQVTVLVNMGVTSNSIDIYAHASSYYLIQHVNDFNRYWCKTYEVMAPNLQILVTNHGGFDVSLTAEIYLIA